MECDLLHLCREDFEEKYRYQAFLRYEPLLHRIASKRGIDEFIIQKIFSHLPTSELMVSFCISRIIQLLTFPQLPSSSALRGIIGFDSTRPLRNQILTGLLASFRTPMSYMSRESEIPLDMRDDYEVMWLAVKSNSCNISQVSERLRADRGLALLVAKDYYGNMENIKTHLKCDIEIIATSLSCKGHHLPISQP